MITLLFLCASYVTSGILFLFFFNDTATTEIYTLSLHDALPISELLQRLHTALGDHGAHQTRIKHTRQLTNAVRRDRKSTRLNSSHANISYAVFCLKKKKIRYNSIETRKKRGKRQSKHYVRWCAT